MIVDFLSNGLIVAACGASAAGCFILSRRLRRLHSAQGGIGRAVAEMSQSVAQLEQALRSAETVARDASARLDARIVEARRLGEALDREVVVDDGASVPRTPERARDAGGGDPLAEIVPKGLSERQATSEVPGKAKSDAVAARKALARFALAARAADRRPSGGEAAA